MQDFIAIAMAADARYAQHAAVAMVSIAAQAAHPEQIRFYFLADAVPDNVLARMRASVEPLGSTLQVVPYSNADREQLFVSGQLSATSYTRLSVAEILPVEVERVLYLDCDIIIMDDIAQLWQCDLQGQAVGAIKDFGIMASHKSWTQKQKFIPLRRDMAYFNAGVLLLDLQIWRQEGYGRTLLELVQKNHFPHHDQDALNLLFCGRWQALPMRWNVIPPVYNMFLKVLSRARFRREAVHALQHPALIHYAGGYKPWEYDLHPGFNDLYYQYLAQSAFRDAPMPQFDARKKHRSIARQMRRLQWGRFWSHLCGGHTDEVKG